MKITDFPLKLYYSIGDVSQIAGVEPHVLRYWESEFKHIHPNKGESGRRRYRKKDIESVLTIKHLLYEKKFTIAGAKQHLAEMKNQTGDLFDMEQVRSTPKPQPPVSAQAPLESTHQQVQAQQPQQPAPPPPPPPPPAPPPKPSVDLETLKEINQDLCRVRDRIKIQIQKLANYPNQ